MTISDYVNSKQSDSYYSTMYMDGYTPEQILMTAHRTFIEEAEDESIGNVQVTSEVNIK